MGILDKLKQKAADAAQAKLDSYAAMIDALPADTIWAASADVEVGSRDDVRGLLSHNGKTIRFQAYRGDLAFEIDSSTVEHRRGEAKTRVDGKRCEIDSVRPLGVGMPIDLPSFADISADDGPMYGFFATLGIPV